jgi:enamine deaminase RidA (YjgF/YER057c/UK114 family)
LSKKSGQSKQKTRVSSGSPFEVPIGFSRAVRVGNQLAIAATPPMAPDGTTVAPDDLYGQTKCCLKIIQEAIEEAGGTIENVIRTRVMLTNIGHWSEAARAHGEVFSEIRPACTFVQVSRLISEDWLVQIEADCVLS